jgi:hypothetical protein
MKITTNLGTSSTLSLVGSMHGRESSRSLESFWLEEVVAVGTR